MPKQRFEFRVFPAGDGGEMKTIDEFVVEEDIDNPNPQSAAKRRAGQLAKQNNGPVDLAYAYEDARLHKTWPDRYITTAMPCDFNKSGIRFERLD